MAMTQVVFGAGFGGSPNDGALAAKGQPTHDKPERTKDPERRANVGIAELPGLPPQKPVVPTPKDAPRES